MAERVIRTIKAKIYKYLKQNNTLTYINVLPILINMYNHTPHRGFGDNQTPAQVHRFRELSQVSRQFKRIYFIRPRGKKVVSHKLDVGDIVHLQRASRTQFKFNKAYTVNNTEELFKISRVDYSHKIPIYYIRDLAGEGVTGAFYREELIKSSLLTHYQVDILRSKVERGKRKYFIRWRGYPDKSDDDTIINRLKKNSRVIFTL